MAESNYTMNSEVDHIANFKHENRESVGHLVSLTIGGEALEADFKFVDPMNPSSRASICGMLTFLEWNKKPGGVITLEGRISAKNQGVFQDALDSGDKTAKCEFKLNVYRYDVATKSYFKCFHTDDQVIEGEISENHTSTVEDQFAPEYRQILNHKFTLVVKGSDEKDSDLHVAYSLDRKKPFLFGGKCGA